MLSSRPLMLSCLFLAFACGGPGPSGASPSPTSPSGGGPETSQQKLQCTTYSWCTTWGGSGNAVKNPPPLTGGTLADGLYRLEEGDSNSAAFAVEGSTVVRVGHVYENTIGTASISGDQLTLTFTRRCSSEGEQALSEAEVSTYKFAVQGEDLFLAYTYETGTGETKRYRRIAPDGLCTESSHFECRVRNCACVSKVNKPMPAPTGDPFSQCS